MELVPFTERPDHAPTQRGCNYARQNQSVELTQRASEQFDAGPHATEAHESHTHSCSCCRHIVLLADIPGFLPASAASLARTVGHSFTSPPGVPSPPFTSLPPGSGFLLRLSAGIGLSVRESAGGPGWLDIAGFSAAHHDVACVWL